MNLWLNLQMAQFINYIDKIAVNKSIQPIFNLQQANHVLARRLAWIEDGLI